MGVRVYKYGLRPPSSHVNIVEEQLLLAHRYRNVLTEIERGRRAAVRALQSVHGNTAEAEQKVVTLRAETAAARLAIKALRAKTRKRSETAEMRAVAKDKAAALKEARAALRQMRRSLRDDVALQARINCRRPKPDRCGQCVECRGGALRRSARKHCGVYWGTYLLIEAQADAARRKPLYDGVEPSDPRFVRWDGQGLLGVQLQGGVDAEALFGADSRLMINPVDPLAWWADKRGDRRRLSRTIVHVRVASQGRAPIFATWPMIMHRPLPPGSRVKAATVRKELVAERAVWTLNITIEMAEGATIGVCGTGKVAVDLGWRLIELQRSGPDAPPQYALRVGSWVGSDGDKGTIVLDPRVISGLQLPQSLRGQRDRNLDALKLKLRAWRDDAADVCPLPGWFAEDARYLDRWKAPDRFRRLMKWWKTHRWEGDSQGFDLLDAWCYRDKHLWEWEANQRRGALRNRREVFRIAAATLAKKYGTLILENFDLSALAARHTTENDVANDDAPRANRVLAAPSELRGCLENAFDRRGGQITYVEQAYTTLECHACGTTCEFDAAASIVHKCEGCGAIWDQDENACRNLLLRELAAGSASSPAAEAKNAGPPKGSKWSRVKKTPARPQPTP